MESKQKGGGCTAGENYLCDNGGVGLRLADGSSGLLLHSH
jgi:hypothetical protein